jgi:transposase
LIFRIDNLFWGNPLLHQPVERSLPAVVQRRLPYDEVRFRKSFRECEYRFRPAGILHPFWPGIHIHIASESLFTSLRNDYSHAPESALYDLYLGKINECDQRIATHLNTMDSKAQRNSERLPEVEASDTHQHPFNLRDHLCRIAGVDLTNVAGLDVQTVQTIISEVGVDMSRWNTEKQFASWLGLCPDNRISGGKVLKRGTRQVVNRAATALRVAAWSLIRSRSALGANFRRLRSKLGAPKAITAMAHKLARLIYRMMKFGAEYVDKGMESYESRYRQQQTKWLAKQAAALNFQLIPVSDVIG